MTDQNPLIAERLNATEILRERARLLARRPRETRAADEEMAVLEFRLASECYAVEQACVREVQPLKDLTPLPGTPAFIRGIINVRGQILPVIDIKRFFDLPAMGIMDLHTVIVVQGNGIELGILADAVSGVRAIARSDIQPSLPTLTGIRADYLKGITGEHVVILDVPAMLADSKIIVDDQIGT